MESSKEDPLLAFIETHKSAPSPATTPPVETVTVKSPPIDPQDRIYELPMLTEQYEMINWPHSIVRYQGLMRIQTPCSRDNIYHAIMNAISPAYRFGKMDGIEVKRDDLVRMLRQDISAAIGRPDNQGSVPYTCLAGGTLAALAGTNPNNTLQAVQNQLLTGHSIPAHLMEFVCDVVGIDLYFISGVNRDVSSVVDDPCTIIKGRRSVIIVYSSNHYELMGIENGDDISSLFCPEHPLVTKLRDRLLSVP